MHRTIIRSLKRRIISPLILATLGIGWGGFLVTSQTLAKETSAAFQSEIPTAATADAGSVAVKVTAESNAEKVAPKAVKKTTKKGAKKNAASASPQAAEKKVSAKSKKNKPEKIRLAHIAIEGSLPESSGTMSLFGDLGLDLRKTIQRIDKVATDDSVQGLILDVRTASFGRGKLNELTEAIGRVRASGKKTIAQLESAFDRSAVSPPPPPPQPSKTPRQPTTAICRKVRIDGHHTVYQVRVPQLTARVQMSIL